MKSGAICQFEASDQKVMCQECANKAALSYNGRCLAQANCPGKAIKSLEDYFPCGGNCLSKEFTQAWCFDQCPFKYREFAKSPASIACDPNCTLTTTKTADKCIADDCKEGSYLNLAKVAAQSVDTRTVFDYQKRGLCASCDSKCKTCQGPGAQRCLSCPQKKCCNQSGIPSPF